MYQRIFLGMAKLYHFIILAQHLKYLRKVYALPANPFKHIQIHDKTMKFDITEVIFI